MLIQSPGSTKDSFRGFPKEELNTTNEKMEQQQQHLQHIKRLLSTAAAGTGIVGDLDAPTAQQMSTLPRKGERNLWRLEEIKEMLSIMQEINALELLNDKMIKSESVFHDIEKVMTRRGYNKKSHNQIWTKWKFLKSTYMTSRRNGLIPKMIPGEIYLILHKMLGNGSHLVYSLEDSSNAASFDGDHSLADDEIENSLLSNSNDQNKSNSKTAAAAAEKHEAFGMAHPIFGFRLGMVKSEPADTGYETTANNSVISENDSLENSAIYPVELSPQNSQDIKPEPDERVTDSPETIAAAAVMQNHSPSPETDNSLLVPRETASMSIRPLAVKQKITPTRSSAALRIAPFAKEANMPDPKCPPPSSRTNNATKQTTEVTASNAGSVFSISPAITMGEATSRGSILRLPRDVTLQLRTNYPNQNDPAYQSKSIPMQKLPSAYALRAEERSTNRSQVSPPSQPKNQHQQPQEQPMTSQMAKLRASILNKKRRLEIPNWESIDSQQLHSKVPRFVSPASIPSSSNIRNSSSYHSNKPRHITSEDNDHNDDGDYDDDDDDDEYDDYGGAQIYTPALFQRPKAYEHPFASTPAQKTKSTASIPPPTPATPPKAAKHRTPMEEILKDMAMSLRQSQLQMVNDFFEQQMELARKEHEFQMEQDRLMMVAFRKQTQQLMQAAQELFGTACHGNGSMNLNAVKNKSNERLKNTANIKHKIANSREPREQIPSQHFELSSSESDELQENGDSDPLLSAFDPTQFVSSELVETNDENDEEESLV